MRLARWLAAACAAALVACGGSEPVVCSASNEGAACGAGATCQASLCARTVTGTVTSRRWLEAGLTEPVPADLSGVFVRAIARTPAGWASLVGTGRADGTFEIPGVPVGRYWLDTSFHGFPRWDERTESAVSFDVQALGRTTTAAPSSTTLNLTGLEPFDGFGGGLVIASVNPWMATEIRSIAADATSASVEIPRTMGLSSAAGDRVFVWQLAQRPLGDLLFTAAVAGAELPAGFEELATIDVPLAPLPVVERAFDWRLAAHSQASSTLGGQQSHELFVRARPHGGEDFELGMFALVGTPSGPGDRTITVSYGRPGLPSWREGYTHRTTAGRVLTGGGWTLNTFAGVESWGLVNESGTTRVPPVLGPPRDLEVVPAPGSTDGRTGQTPTIRWAAPSVGTPAGYSIQVRPRNGPSVMLLPLPATTSVEIPPGIVPPADPFYVRVNAFADSGLASDIRGNFLP